MDSFPFFKTSWTVSDITRYIRETLESDYRLQDVWVSGEVSNLSRPSSGHLYFSLKDEGASLRCVMWRSLVDSQTYLPASGDSVEVRGHISVYEPGGQYQLYASHIRPVGEGIRFQELLELKSKLEGEGLFDPDRKRPLPPWPQCIGVITSPTGAALQDVLNVLQRRYPLVEIVIAPTPVQGDEAPAGIARAFSALNTSVLPDLILLVRGGGSVEDLWAFNDEVVVRGIAASASPVVTGIGHETDFILADLAADVRAPTPSAAAEIATPDSQDLLSEIASMRRILSVKLKDAISQRRRMHQVLDNALQLVSPRAKIANTRQRVDDLNTRGWVAAQNHIRIKQASLLGLAQTLQAFDPLAVLGRGYAVVTRTDTGRLVNTVDLVDKGDLLNVRVQDGRFKAAVQGKAKRLTKRSEG